MHISRVISLLLYTVLTRKYYASAETLDQVQGDEGVHAKDSGISAEFGRLVCPPLPYSRKSRNLAA